MTRFDSYGLRSVFAHTCPAMIGDRPVHIKVNGGVDRIMEALVGAAGAGVLLDDSAMVRCGLVKVSEVYVANMRTIQNAVRR